MKSLLLRRLQYKTELCLNGKIRNDDIESNLATIHEAYQFIFMRFFKENSIIGQNVEEETKPEEETENKKTKRNRKIKRQQSNDVTSNQNLCPR